MKKAQKLIALLLCLIMILGAFVGCGDKKVDGDNNSTDDNGGKTDTDDTPDDSGDPIVKLNLALTEEVNTVDPTLNESQAAMTMVTLTNEGLMSFDDKGEVTFGLADSYELSEDGLTYTFHIRDDAYWNNGEKVTSQDFLFSWQRLVDPNTGAMYAFMLGTCGVKNAFNVAYAGADMSTLGISAPDDETFIVELDIPRSYFLYLLALSSFYMPINEAYFNECGDQFGLDVDHYLACGPYVFSEWEVGGTSYSLVKNEDYYDVENVDADELSFKVITDGQQQMMGWDNGTLDFVGLGGDYLELYRDDPALNISDMAAMFFLSFNTEDENLANENLRMALSLAIDKTSIVNNILNNGSLVADYIIPATFAVDSTGKTYRDRIGNPTYNTMDKAKAAELWETAKKELGIETLTLELMYNEDTSIASSCAFLQSEWQTTLPGLTIELVQTTYNNRLELMGQHDFQIGFTRWFADYQDAMTYLDMWIGTSQMNYGSYFNEEYEALYQKAIGEYALDEEARIKTQAEMEAMILGDAAICPLYQLAACVLQNTDYNWVKNVAGVVQYKHVGLK